MNAIEATAVFEDPAHLRLTEPVQVAITGPVKLIVLFTDQAAPAASVNPPDFRGAIGSYYRDHPQEAPRDSVQWMDELREGEVD